MNKPEDGLTITLAEKSTLEVLVSHIIDSVRSYTAEEIVGAVLEKLGIRLTEELPAEGAFWADYDGAEGPVTDAFVRVGGRGDSRAYHLLTPDGESWSLTPTGAGHSLSNMRPIPVPKYPE